MNFFKSGIHLKYNMQSATAVNRIRLIESVTSVLVVVLGQFADCNQWCRSMLSIGGDDLLNLPIFCQF